MGDVGTIRVNNVFTSFDGEVNAFYQGRVSTFIRLQGCNLQCPYCDATQAQDVKGGKRMFVEELAVQVIEMGTDKFTITGGEPFLQSRAILDLIAEIGRRKDNAQISIETNGTLPIPSGLNPDVSLIVDYKMGIGQELFLAAFEGLTSMDFVKFVISDIEEFREALEAMRWIKELNIRGELPQFAFSPVHGKVAPEELAKWILVTKIPDAILNLQLHKYVWPDSKEDC
jgi:7-carboxy-7-deazaguanine synthase